MKTYSAKPVDIKRTWYVLDASQAPMGRVASAAAVLLLGKHKPIFTSHVDCGDYVIVINAAQVVTTGTKLDTKKYHSHSLYPGGLTTKTMRQALEQDPTKVLNGAIRNMLPSNKLRDGRLQRLKIYAGAEHHHEAQVPQEFPLNKDSK